MLSEGSWPEHQAGKLIFFSVCGTSADSQGGSLLALGMTGNLRFTSPPTAGVQAPGLWQEGSFARSGQVQVGSRAGWWVETGEENSVLLAGPWCPFLILGRVLS